MAKYTIELDFYQDQYGEENALASVKFDGEMQTESFEVSSADINTPNTFEFVTDKPDGVYTLEVRFLNDSYADEAGDRNLNWCNTRINGVEIPWDSMDSGSLTFPKSEDSVYIDTWEDFQIPYETFARTDISLP